MNRAMVNLKQPASPWNEIEPDIWHLGRPINSSEGGWHQPGYYFLDETADFNGPFDSHEKAKLALQQHAESI